MTLQSFDATPETYDRLLALLLWAGDDARKEGMSLWARVFDDAATAAARAAGDLRDLAEGRGIRIPGERSLFDVKAELDGLRSEGLSFEDAWAFAFPPERLSPNETGPCIKCLDVFAPGDVAVKAPSQDEIGYGHLECLSVVIVDDANLSDPSS